MMKNRLLEIIKNREKGYVQQTEEAIELFITTLKKGLEIAFYDDQDVELYILDVSIVPQNFRFLHIDGKLITVNVGDKVEINDEIIEVDLENIWDFAKQFSVIIPAALLDEGDENQVADYLKKVRENNDKIPASIMSEYKTSDKVKTREFEKVTKELDEDQRMALKYFKSQSIH